MTDIILLVIILAVGIVSYRMIRSASKRIFLMIKLRELKKESGAKIKYHTLPFLSLLKFSAKPEITVELEDTVYLIRLIGASSKHRRVHFANPEYTVTIRGARVSRSVKSDKDRKIPHDGTQGPLHPYDYDKVRSSKVRILPKLQMPASDIYRGKKVVPVLIFNPAPHEVTYVTQEKNKILAAFTGDKVYGHVIFTASSFVTYADRAAREKRDKRQRDKFNYEYFS